MHDESRGRNPNTRIPPGASRNLAACPAGAPSIDEVGWSEDRSPDHSGCFLGCLPASVPTLPLASAPASDSTTRISPAEQAGLWNASRYGVGVLLGRVGGTSLWQQRSGPGLDALQVVLGSFPHGTFSDVFRVVRGKTPVVVSHHAVRACESGPLPPDNAVPSLPHVVAVTFPDRLVDDATAARLASCTQGAFWTTPTIDSVSTFESDPVLVEAVQGGHYQAIHLRYFKPLDSDDASRVALKECLRALGVAEPGAEDGG